MVAVARPGSEDFWSRAPELFELACRVGRDLEVSADTDEVAEQVHHLADLVPATPEALGGTDPYLRSALLTAVIHALRAQEMGNRSELRVAVERIRQALRDLLDEQPVWRDGPKGAALWLRQARLPVEDLTELLDASESSIRRWSNPSDPTEPGDDSRERVMAVAKIVNHLRHSLTPRGVVQWLLRPHPALDYRRPVDELKDPASYRSLINLASGARSFHPT